MATITGISAIGYSGPPRINDIFATLGSIMLGNFALGGDKFNPTITTQSSVPSISGAMIFGQSGSPVRQPSGQVSGWFTRIHAGIPLVQISAIPGSIIGVCGIAISIRPAATPKNINALIGLAGLIGKTFGARFTGAVGFTAIGTSYSDVANAIYGYEGFDNEFNQASLSQGIINNFINCSGIRSSNTPYNSGSSLSVQVIGTSTAVSGYAIYNSGPWTLNAATVGVMTQSSIFTSVATDVGFVIGNTAQVFCRIIGCNICVYRGPTSAPTLLRTILNVVPAIGWFYLEFKTVIATLTGSVIVAVNGVQVASYTNLNTSADTTPRINGVLLGGLSRANTITNFLFDDVYVATLLLGPVRVSSMVPTGNGSLVQFISTNPSNNWKTLLIDNGDTEYNFGNTYALADEFFASPVATSIGVISALKVTIQARKDAAPDLAMQTLVLSNVTRNSGQRVPLANTYQYLSDIFAIDPNTGTSWTRSGLNAIQIGYKIASTASSSDGITPTLDINFLNGADARLTTTRAAGGATVFDATGTLVMAAANTQRIDHTPVRQLITSSTINLSYSTGDFIFFSPGADLIFTPTIAGLFIGTAVILHTRNTNPDSNVGTYSLNILPGNLIVGSIYVWIPSAWTGTSVRLACEGNLTSTNVAANLSLRNQWQRLITTSNSATTGLSNMVVRNNAPVGSLIYSTAWQFEYGSAATTYQPSLSGIVTTEPIGLLSENPRTNSLRNPRAEGAVVSGAYPTDVTTSNTVPSGTVTVTAINVIENGLPAVDITFAGTPTAPPYVMNYNFCPSTQIIAANGQTWTGSVYARLIAGSYPSGTTLWFEINEKNSSGTTLVSGNLVATLPTSAPLAGQRIAYTYTNSNASTAFISADLKWTITTAGAFSFKIRIAIPQLELGGYATSPILPLIGSPSATTRPIEDIQMNFVNSYNASAGTLFGSVIFEGLGESNQGVVMLDDGGVEANNVLIWNQTTNLNSRLTTTSVASSPRSYPVTANTVAKAILSWDNFNTTSAMNAVNVSVPQPFNAPVGISRLVIGRIHQTAGTWSSNGWIQRVTYWTRALSRTEMITTTT